MSESEMPVEKVGIKETKEALVGVLELVLFLSKQLKDGVQYGDFEVLFQKLSNDDVFYSKLKDAYVGFIAVPDEIKDLDLSEIVELGGVVTARIPELMEMLKG